MQRVNGYVHIIDGDGASRVSLSQMLRSSGYAVQEFSNAQQFLDQSLPTSPAVILMEMQIPDMPGIQLQKRLKEIKRSTPILFIASQAAPQQLIDGMKNGAIDILLKPFGLERLLEAINEAIDLDKKLSKRIVREVGVVKNYKSLTTREREVCQLLAKGLLSKEVAEKLGVTPSTVKIQKSKMMKKMQATSTEQLAIMYTQNHLEKVKP